MPDWEKLYQTEEVETLPWFHPNLDQDLESALDKMNIESGKVLDLGTGPGTQALALAERGFTVIATDVSPTAINKAIRLASGKGLDITFLSDDVLNTKLIDEFDFVFDRGCFHTLPPQRRADYVRTVFKLVKPGGYLFLKCFSIKETMEGGPYRFTPEELKELFGGAFKIHSISETIYQGTLQAQPKALFCVFQRPK